MKRIVLDTNCLIASLSKRGKYFNVWKGLRFGVYTLCVSNEIIEEYEEILTQKINPQIAANVIQTILNSPFVEKVDPHFKFHLIEEDEDDNKFVDCAIVANASYIVSNDRHFNILKTIPFPKVELISIAEFSEMLG